MREYGLTGTLRSPVNFIVHTYSKHYRITKDELEWLGAQVEELGRVAHVVCSERIEKLEAEAKARPDRVR